jgi:hypothetical protein
MRDAQSSEQSGNPGQPTKNIVAWKFNLFDLRAIRLKYELKEHSPVFSRFMLEIARG